MRLVKASDRLFAAAPPPWISARPNKGQRCTKGYGGVKSAAALFLGRAAAALRRSGRAFAETRCKMVVDDRFASLAVSRAAF
jgi:hypothetical protein